MIGKEKKKNIGIETEGIETEEIEIEIGVIEIGEIEIRIKTGIRIDLLRKEKNQNLLIEKEEIKIETEKIKIDILVLGTENTESLILDPVPEIVITDEKKRKKLKKK
jgi:hypothetical protein